jgi:radical SAM superfamily enzyme YgiQ (UPF0313 family)
VIKEIKEIKESAVFLERMKDYVFFMDEVFGNDKAWLDEFESIYKKEIGLPFYAEYNPKSISSTTLDKLNNAGVHTINFGIQTGSDYIRNHVFKRPGKNSEIVRIAKEIADRDITIKYDLIIDNPYDTEESLKDTIDILLKLPKPLLFNLYSLQYFPDYPLTKKAIEDGHIRVDDAGSDSLMERTTRNWAFVPRMVPFGKRQMLQNAIWCIVWGHVSDGIVKYAVHNDSVGARLCLHYVNLKAVLLGKIIGVGGIWLQYLIHGFRLLLRGDTRTLYQKIKKRLIHRAQSTPNHWEQ